jgi:hypothetical protein
VLLKSLGKFLDEVNPCAIDNASIISVENGGSENIVKPLDDFFPGNFDHRLVNVGSMQRS